MAQNIAPLPPQNLEHDRQVVVLERRLVVVQVSELALGRDLENDTTTKKSRQKLTPAGSETVRN